MLQKKRASIRTSNSFPRRTNLHGQCLHSSGKCKSENKTPLSAHKISKHLKVWQYPALEEMQSLKHILRKQFGNMLKTCISYNRGFYFRIRTPQKIWVKCTACVQNTHLDAHYRVAYNSYHWEKNGEIICDIVV